MERFSWTNLSAPFDIFFQSFFFFRFERYLPFLALARCPISRKTFFFSFLFFKEISNTFREWKCERKGGWRETEAKFSIFFTKQSHERLLPQAPPTPDQCAHRSFIYLFFPPLSLRCNCFRKKEEEKEKEQIYYTTAHFLTIKVLERPSTSIFPFYLVLSWSPIVCYSRKAIT